MNGFHHTASRVFDTYLLKHYAHTRFLALKVLTQQQSAPSAAQEIRARTAITLVINRHLHIGNKQFTTARADASKPKGWHGV